MEKITFECETITPMFLAGADGKTPELRAPSIKGALRFWWRAMHGHLSLDELKKREGAIFGGTKARSKILLRIISVEEIISDDSFRNTYDQNYDLFYMAFGVEDRIFYKEGTRFNVVIKIMAKDKKERKQLKDEIRKAFTLLAHLGGLGAKSRNGFGSFSCSGVDSFKVMSNYEIFYADIEADFTTISNISQIYQSGNLFKSWTDAMKEMKGLYSNNKKTILPKNDRKYIAAPYKSARPPDRHSKLHLMSIILDEKKFRYIMTYLPYMYLSQYPDLTEKKIKTHYNKWTEVVDYFNDKIEKDQNQNGDYLVDFTFNENDK